MYDPHINIAQYFKNTLRKPEGILFVVLVAIYVIGFIFFDAASTITNDLGGSLSGGYRAAFLCMPLLLLVIFLRMDISAKSAGERLLTALVLLVTASVPVLRAFGFF